LLNLHRTAAPRKLRCATRWRPGRSTCVL